MNTSEAIKNRKSVRAYLNKAVDHSTIVDILDTARWAASGTNTQPWQVAVLTGNSKVKLQNQIIQAYSDGTKPKMDYNYYPVEWREPYKSRRFKCGMALYEALDIKKEDVERRKQQWLANYRAFDAPVMLMFSMESVMERGSYMDFGMFLQSVMLAAMDHGLASCPQAALAEYPNLVRQHLGYDDNVTVLCGMALGYEDTDAAVNNYRTQRESVDSIAQFFE